MSNIEGESNLYMHYALCSINIIKKSVLIFQYLHMYVSGCMYFYSEPANSKTCLLFLNNTIPIKLKYIRRKVKIFYIFNHTCFEFLICDQS